MPREITAKEASQYKGMLTVQVKNLSLTSSKNVTVWGEFSYPSELNENSGTYVSPSEFSTCLQPYEISCVGAFNESSEFLIDANHKYQITVNGDVYTIYGWEFVDFFKAKEISANIIEM